MSRFTFKKNERLSSRKAIEELYEKGKSFYVKNLKIIYLVQPENSAEVCQVVFSVPKKSFKRAVDRNLLKRRMRESYRLSKHEFYNHLIEKKIQLHVLILYTPKEILLFDEINKNIKQALQTLNEKTSPAAH